MPKANAIIFRYHIAAIGLLAALSCDGAPAHAYDCWPNESGCWASQMQQLEDARNAADAIAAAAAARRDAEFYAPKDSEGRPHIGAFTRELLDGNDRAARDALSDALMR
jgi:hypothetical protein